MSAAPDVDAALPATADNESCAPWREPLWQLDECRRNEVATLRHRVEPVHHPDARKEINAAFDSGTGFAHCVGLLALSDRLAGRCIVDGHDCEHGYRMPSEGNPYATPPLLKPCGCCRTWLEHAAARLRGVRLGRVDRRVLLDVDEAPVYRSELVIAAGFHLSRQELTAGQYSAMRRSIAKLRDLALVWESAVVVDGVTRDRQGRRRINHNLRTYRRSWFGEAVVKRYRRELVSGERIRWDGRVAEAVDEAARDAAAIKEIEAIELERLTWEME